ncbi:MAG: glycoside hydrolase family 13 protein [Muribaculaceae bacterium]|nr:glycoside hydrolase family 13 protein [Muribaculaceae bacterium]
MKKRKALLLCAAIAGEAVAAISVDKIDPPYWWVGMHDTSLQLQIHGKDIKDAEVSVDYPGVSIDSVARLDGSPNWQYIYLNISQDAKPGTMKLKWKSGKDRVAKDFQLKARKEMKGAQGFSAEDVLYMIMPDRFASGGEVHDEAKSLKNSVSENRKNPNSRHGGDIKGIADHINYIDSLGITAVWLNPVLENDMPGGSYHGYATTDYYRVDPRLGTNQEYAELIERLHGRGIKMVMDMIFNHSGSEHPWALDPPASDWFNHQGDYKQTNYRLSTITDPYASEYDKDLTVNGWFVESMPDLNQKNPHLMKYLTQNSIFWIEDAQIDGIRMDTYPYADMTKMGEWIDAVKAEYPDFNIVGECWYGSPAGEQFWQTGSAIAASKGIDTRLPVVMDFPLSILCADLKPFKVDSQAWNGINEVYDHFALDYVYANPMNVLRFLDNHDTDRFILEMPDNLDTWKQAMAMLLTVPGIPQIYYGTELLMNGSKEGSDGYVRLDVPGGFKGDKENQFEASGRSDLQNEAYDFIATVNNWRKTSKAIGKGDMKHFMPTNGVYLYRRKYGSEEAIVILNGKDEDLDLDMSRYAEIIKDGESYTDIFSGENVVLRNGDKKLHLPGRATKILYKK